MNPNTYPLVFSVLSLLFSTVALFGISKSVSRIDVLDDKMLDLLNSEPSDSIIQTVATSVKAKTVGPSGHIFGGHPHTITHDGKQPV